MAEGGRRINPRRKRLRPGAEAPGRCPISASRASLPARRGGEADLPALTLPGPASVPLDPDAQLRQATGVFVPQCDPIDRIGLGAEVGTGHVVRLPVAPAGAGVRIIVPVAVHLRLGRRALKLRGGFALRRQRRASGLALVRRSLVAILPDVVPRRALLAEGHHADPSHVAIRLTGPLGVRVFLVHEYEATNLVLRSAPAADRGF